jgi:SRSO17 transposase
MRWPIEIIFEEGKGQVGLDEYQTRSWLGWHHHMILSFLAHHFLVRLRVKFKVCSCTDHLSGPAAAVECAA